MPKPSNSQTAPLALRRIGVVDEILQNLYRNPHHGNKQDPVDELIYIVLSQRTRRAAYEVAFDALKRRGTLASTVITWIAAAFVVGFWTWRLV